MRLELFAAFLWAIGNGNSDALLKAMIATECLHGIHHVS